MDIFNENVSVEFMRRDMLCLSWYEHNNQCWVPFQHILCTVKNVRSGWQLSQEKEDYQMIISSIPKNIR